MKYVSSITTKYGDIENVKKDIKVLNEILSRQGSSLLIRTSHFETDILNIVAEYDMKNTACKELRDNLLSDAKLLSKYVEFKCQRHLNCSCTNHEKCNCTPF